MSKAAVAQPASSLSRFWHKWRFHINVLLILIPLGFMPKYFADNALDRGDTGLGQREIGEFKVGPWSLRLAEDRNEAPRLSGASGYMKGFNAALCNACIDRVKATYLRIGKPRSLRTAGVIFFGGGYRMGAFMQIPETTHPDSELWITMEGWDGSVHQTSIPLQQASPTTVAWLKKQGAKP
ncbi:thiamine pyrophosphate-binding protein [Pseudomonas alliivorans]|uniref:Thiamine pyrophosphate-binding protein n=1 Tax=Pseudomonas alliivorans TaxID=2810613 RepID=A0ABS4CA64_9PSED|nr:MULTISPECIES: thiamine pyrophosphate-binding protein [Pseudomonas]MCD5983754.1 thiamine pyrophosphate-binding protein [Pseudomonas sp. CDFA 610]MBP0947234.1 thiamine pyrophosphate-binding protein [Pseudomonas alliivorans]MBP0949797.1 thiamine pyrophosphate-binding protein [Pseudomonas alliivorans]MCO5368073.1 thiamine pyrophosphate-binding protein [Pseudomonas alliivorans]MCQ9472355.1 thiamine pyrophosphate-binding protein [Pseudomonas alliivorans]